MKRGSRIEEGRYAKRTVEGRCDIVYRKKECTVYMDRQCEENDGEQSLNYVEVKTETSSRQQRIGIISKDTNK